MGQERDVAGQGQGRNVAGQGQERNVPVHRQAEHHPVIHNANPVEGDRMYGPCGIQNLAPTQPVRQLSLSATIRRTADPCFDS